MFWIFIYLLVTDERRAPSVKLPLPQENYLNYIFKSKEHIRIIQVHLRFKKIPYRELKRTMKVNGHFFLVFNSLSLWSDRQGRQCLQTISSFDHTNYASGSLYYYICTSLLQTELLFWSESYLRVVFVPISPKRFRDSSSVWMFSVCARMRTICTISSCE